MSCDAEEQQAALAVTGEKPSRLLQFKPPRIAMTYMAIAVVLHFLSPEGTVLFVPYRPLGALVLAAGFVLMMWSWASFKRQATPHCLTADATSLIEQAPYSFSRNPMYLGMLLMLAGAAFLLGSMLAFSAPAAFFVTIDNVFIPHEEQSLQRVFGSRYSAYRGRVRRWL